MDIFNHLCPEELYKTSLWIDHNAWVYNRLNYPNEYGPDSLYYSRAKYLPIYTDKYFPIHTESIFVSIKDPKSMILDAKPVPFYGDCPICYETVVDPHSLNCKHIFCKECIVDWWKTEKLTCPTCRVEM